MRSSEIYAVKILGLRTDGVAGMHHCSPRTVDMFRIYLCQAQKFSTKVSSKAFVPLRALVELLRPSIANDCFRAASTSANASLLDRLDGARTVEDFKRQLASIDNKTQDQERVLDGTKMFVATSNGTDQKADTFKFSCTACGKCCRNLSAFVLVDPSDAWNIAAHTAGMTGRSFSGKLGMFMQSDLGDAGRGYSRLTGITPTLDVGPAWRDVLLVQRQGVAPVTFLQPSDIEKSGDRRCSFARPLAVDDAVHRVSGPLPAQRKLMCSLGPAGQPYACSLYPLGDVWSSPAMHAYSLDFQGCEGVDDGTSRTQAISRTVAEYRATNKLEPRQAAAHWFRRLATAHACSGIDIETLRAVRQQVATRIRQTHRASAKHTRKVAEALLQIPDAAIPWLRDAVLSIEDHVAGTGASWATVSAQDVLLRCMRDRVRSLWYTPVEAGVVSRHTFLHAKREVKESGKTLPGWEAVQIAIEGATKEFHDQWSQHVLPVVAKVN